MTAVLKEMPAAANANHADARSSGNDAASAVKTLPQLLREQARTQPDRVAIRQKDFGIWKPCTWSQYYARAAHFGLGLRMLGAPAKGHVAIISENRIEWVLAQMGGGLVDLVTVGVYPTSPASEVAYVLAHADVDLIVCEDQEQTDKVLEVIDQLPRLLKIIVIETKGLRSYSDAQRARLVTFAEVEALGADAMTPYGGIIEETLAQQTPDDIGLMIYTSGSTGKPKGAMISYANMAAVVPGIVERCHMDASTTHLSYLPLCHVAEQMLTTFVPITIGSQVNFGESIRTVQEDLRELAPTMFLGVPRIWEKMQASIMVKMQETGRLRRWMYERALAACRPFAEKSPQQRGISESLRFYACYWLLFRALQNFIGLRRTRVALTGAAPIPPETVRFFRTIGIPLIEVYGLTESTGMITGHRLDRVRIGNVGEPTVGVEAKVGENDELLVRGGMVFCGYYKNPEETARTIRDGWLHTGDAVRIEDGCIRIVDRLKDIMITAGGKNLTPSEIENAVKGSHYIKECIVIAEARKFVAALVQIDYEVVGKWAESRRLPFTHFRSLVELPQVRELVAAEIDRANGQLAQVAHIRRFHLLTKELDHDDGEVTATMKVRRSSIYKAYAAEIEALYAG